MPDRLDPELIRLAVVMVVGALAPLLDATIVTVALDPMTRQFSAPLSTIQWVVSGYLLAQAMVIPATGWAIERFGAKTLWMASLALFTLGSALSGAAWSAGSLIGFRIVQGVGGGALLPLAAVVLTQAAGPRRLGRVMAIVGVPTQVAPIIGPLVGGLIIDSVGWRWCFYLNGPICLVAVFLAWRLMPNTPGQPGQRLDVRGLMLLSPALGVLTYGLSRAATVGFTDSVVMMALGAGVLLLAGFIGHALRTQTVPLIDLRLFARRSFASASVLVFLLSFSIFGAMVVIPLYFQQVRGTSAFEAGMLIAPQFAGTLVALLFLGKLTDRLPARILVLGGMLIACTASLALTQLGTDPAPVLLGAALFVRGMGFAATTTAVMAAAYRGLEPEVIPRATSALQIGQRIGAPFGAAVLVLILQLQLAGSHATAGRAAAYGATFWWALALTAPAVIPALLLGHGHTRSGAGNG